MRAKPTLTVNLPPALALVTPLVAVLLFIGAAGASARDGRKAHTAVQPVVLSAPFQPPAHKIFAGVGGFPPRPYLAAIGKHPAVYEDFIAWGEYLPGIVQEAVTLHARMVLSITSQYGSTNAITPAQVAAGDGDAWLIGLQRQIAASGNITYVRLFPEMDYWANDYSAFNENGSPRGPAFSTFEFRQAWKRVTLIMRGGPLAHIDAVLARLRMPPLRTHAGLPTPQVAMMWVPQTLGTPMRAANQPKAYWPGSAWVDWVGTDFYSSFPEFRWLSSFYREFRGKPFAFGEWALWGADSPGFVKELFRWTFKHPRTQMMIYNEGINPVGPFQLWRYPAGSATLRNELASARFPAYAPGWGP